MSPAHGPDEAPQEGSSRSGVDAAPGPHARERREEGRKGARDARNRGERGSCSLSRRLAHAIPIGPRAVQDNPLHAPHEDWDVEVDQERRRLVETGSGLGSSYVISDSLRPSRPCGPLSLFHPPPPCSPRSNRCVRRRNGLAVSRGAPCRAQRGSAHRRRAAGCWAAPYPPPNQFTCSPLARRRPNSRASMENSCHPASGTYRMFRARRRSSSSPDGSYSWSHWARRSRRTGPRHTG